MNVWPSGHSTAVGVSIDLTASCRIFGGVYHSIWVVLMCFVMWAYNVGIMSSSVPGQLFIITRFLHFIMNYLKNLVVVSVFAEVRQIAGQLCYLDTEL